MKTFNFFIFGALAGLSIAFLVAPVGRMAAKAAPADASACYNVADADARTYCLARARSEPSACYSIQRPDLRSLCLAEARK